MAERAHIETARDDRAGAAVGPAELRRRRRGPSLWDVRPEGYVEGHANPLTTAAPPVDARLPSGATGGSAPSQQTRHARRLYVGGLADQSEVDISNFFADLVKSACVNPVKGNPIVSVYVNPERKFAFVEFNSIELANSFMDLDGLVYKGHPVKIRRPDDYKPDTLPYEVRDRKEALNYSMLPMGGGFGGGGTRIHIANMPPALEEQMLTELVAAFGAVRKVEVGRNVDGSPTGNAYVEFVEPATCELAIAGLNNLAVLDRSLVVTHAKATGEHMPAGYGFDARPPPPAAPAGPVSRVVLLDNMVDAAELTAQDAYVEIKADVEAECSKYGRLLSVHLPRPPAPGAGRVFLQYEDVTGATTAIEKLTGRQFGGRMILLRFYDEATFAAAVYTA